MREELNPLYEPPQSVSRSNRKKITLIVLVLIAGIGLYYVLPLLLVVFVAQPIRVAGAAMVPTLNDGDRVFISKRVGTLQRGDIVVFNYPEDPSKSFIERVIGLPGDRLDVDLDGNITVNAQVLKEEYLNPSRNRAARSRWRNTMQEWKEIKPDHYFVMGDNRDVSNDSRSWGQVPRDLIYGKYLFRYWASRAD
jgi:signal peptidase I